MRYAMLMFGGMVGMLLVVLLGGCSAATTPRHLDVPSGEYAATFDAARAVLREARFDLERVDAGLGVISTGPKHSAGFMTPWDSEQSTIGQEFEDFAHNQRRVVRVTFEPAGAGAGADEPPLDLRDADVPTRMSVRVIVLRDYKPGWQVQTSSVRLSQHTYDPALGRRGMQPDYETAISEDQALAARLTREIGEAVGKGRE